MQRSLVSKASRVCRFGAGKRAFSSQNADVLAYDSVDQMHDITKLDGTKAGDTTNRAFTYATLATSFASGSAIGSSVVQKFVATMDASADVVAASSTEVDLTTIPLGKVVTVKWQGKPVFICHRNDELIQMSRDDDNAALRDPCIDADRVKDPEWLVLIGICTHLGCVPVSGQGNYPGGYFCPCHGSHYDSSGRIRKGPAPLNLEIPNYQFIDGGKTLLIL